MFGFLFTAYRNFLIPTVLGVYVSLLGYLGKRVPLEMSHIPCGLILPHYWRKTQFLGLHRSTAFLPKAKNLAWLDIWYLARSDPSRMQGSKFTIRRLGATCIHSWACLSVVTSNVNVNTITLRPFYEPYVGYDSNSISCAFCSFKPSEIIGRLIEQFGWM
jgi:hypothetical protein